VMSQEPWKSSIATVGSKIDNICCHANNTIVSEEDEVLHHDPTTMIDVPFDGWYIFCFGILSQQQEKEQSSYIQTTPTSLPTQQQDSITYKLLIHQPCHNTTNQNNDNGNDDNQITCNECTVTRNDGNLPPSTTIEIKLPLLLQHIQSKNESTRQRKRKHNYSNEQNDGDGNKLSMSNNTSLLYNNMNIGNLIYLQQKCTLSVICETETDETISLQPRSTIQQQQRQQQQSEQHTDTNARNNVVQWCIVHFPHSENTISTSHTDHDDPNRNDTTTTTKTTTTSPPPNGTISTRKKPYICRFCYKSFPTIRGIQNHITILHMNQDDNNDADGSSRSLTTIVQPHLVPCSRQTENTQTTCRNDKHIIHVDDTATEINMINGNQNIYEQPLMVLYQDTYMAIIIKPQGMTVMGDRPSLIRCNLLMSLKCTPKEREQLLLSSDKALGKPRPVHRLDNATGGILVIAKTHHADEKLRTSFMNRKCHKRYRALLIGKLILSSPDINNSSSSSSLLLPPYVTLINNDDDDNTSMNHHHQKCYHNTNDSQQQQEQPSQVVAKIVANVDGKESQTLIRIVRYIERKEEKQDLGPEQNNDESNNNHTSTSDGSCWYTMVDLWPITGRRHQLRKHMKLIGYSIYGDTRYRSTQLASSTAISTTSIPKLYNNSNGKDTEYIMSSLLNRNTDKNKEHGPQQHSLSSSLPPLCLWAMEITIPHPWTGHEMTFQLPNHDDPNWFHPILNREM
jgi:23S rRNA-/tRNA-specific pseudouridylate synthase